jgi:hypothetical protein
LIDPYPIDLFFSVCKDWKLILSEEVELKKNVILDLGTLPHANLVTLAERDGFGAFLTWIFGVLTTSISVICPPDWNEMAVTDADALVDVLNCCLLLLKTFGQATRRGSIPSLVVYNYRMRNALLIEILASNRAIGAEVSMTLKNCVFSFDCCDPSDDRQMRQFNVLLAEATVRFGVCFVPDMLLIADAILPGFKDMAIMTETLRQIIQEDSLQARTYRLGLFEFLKRQATF